MFCPTCGKELPDDSVFCQSCGTKLDGTQPNEAQPNAWNEKLKQASSTVADATRTLGGKIKDTAQNYYSDVNQAVKSKDAKSFFTKNKYRNLIITVTAVVLIVILVGLGASNLSNSKYTKLADYDTVHSFNGQSVHSKVIGKSKTNVYVLSSCKKDNVAYEVLWIYNTDTLKSDGPGKFATKAEHTNWNEIVKLRIKNDNQWAEDMKR